MKKLIFFGYLILGSFAFAPHVTAQITDANPIDFTFNQILDKKAVGYTGLELFVGRNLSSDLDKNFASFVLNTSSWNMVKVRPKIKFFSQVGRTDEIFFQGGGNGKILFGSLSNDIQWNPDTSLIFNKSRFGIVGHQEFGMWFEYLSKKRRTFSGLRLRNYSNIYALSLDSGLIANRFTSPLQVGNEYVVFGRGQQTYLGSNPTNLESIFQDPISFLLNSLVPNNILLLLDYSEKINLSEKLTFHFDLHGIPLFANLGNLKQREVSLDWRFQGINLSKLDSSFSPLGLVRDTSIETVSVQLNSRNSVLRPSKKIQIGINYKPISSIQLKADYQYILQHFYSTNDLSLKILTDHGDNLKIMAGLHVSSQFGPWSEFCIFYKPIPKTTLFMKGSGLDIVSWKDSLEFKKNFRILQVSIGLVANF